MEEKKLDGTARIKDLIRERITAMFDEILTYSEVAVPNKYTYDKLRNRVLTAGNNAIRNLQADADIFDISYIPEFEIIKMEEEE